MIFDELTVKVKEWKGELDTAEWRAVPREKI